MEVLCDRQRRKDVLRLRDEVHSAPGQPVGAGAGHVLAFEPNRAATRSDQPVDGFEQRRLAGAVRPHDGDDLLALDNEVRASDDEGVVVARLERGDLEHGRAQWAVPR
jgi:hypothetical protein